MAHEWKISSNSDRQECFFMKPNCLLCRLHDGQDRHDGPLPSKMSDIEPADKTLEVNENWPSKTKIRRAIQHLKNSKAAGPDGIPPETIKACLRTSTEVLFELFGKIWETKELLDEWKEGYLIKLPKGDVRESKNWRGIM